MSDLISRQAAIDALGENPLVWTEDEYELGLQNQWQSDVDALNDLPSAQPEIIHCRECKHHRQDNHGLFYCSRKEYGYGWGLNDFCSKAERRGE